MTEKHIHGQIELKSMAML